MVDVCGLATRAELAAKRADGMARPVGQSLIQKRRPALVGMLGIGYGLTACGSGRPKRKLSESRRHGFGRDL
jgi:hypothetical protein